MRKQRQALLDEGTLWNGGGVYDGPQVFAVYDYDPEGEELKAVLGRTTPQFYRYSELVYNEGVAYATTNYPAFGGLLSVIQGGQKGTWALSAGFTDRKAHSIAFAEAKLYGLIAQSHGLTLSTFPLDQFGVTGTNHWKDLVVLEDDESSVFDPVIQGVGQALWMAYIHDGEGQFRFTASPASVNEPRDLPVAVHCPGAKSVDVASIDGSLVAACATGEAVRWWTSEIDGELHFVEQPVPSSWSADRVQLAAGASGVSLLLGNEDEFTVYEDWADPSPIASFSSAGDVSLLQTNDGLALLICDEEGKTSELYLY